MRRAKIALYAPQISGIKKAAQCAASFIVNGGPDETRTRDLRRDRPAF